MLWRAAAKHLAAGCLPIHAGTWQQLQALAAQSPTQQTEQQQQPLPANATARPLQMATQLCHPAKATEDPYLAISPPLYQTATFGQPSATTGGPYDYTRSGNPTRTLLETQLADLEASAVLPCTPAAAYFKCYSAGRPVAFSEMQNKRATLLP